MIFLSHVKEFFTKNIKPHLSSSLAIIIVTALCVLSIGISYFRRQDKVSPLMLVGTVIVPFQQGINDIGSFFFKTETDRLTLEEAKNRIASLEEENAGLYRKVQDQESLEMENRELRALLKAKERLSDYDSQAAEVIGNDGTNFFERFTINKGSADGIKVNMNVIDRNGLVGIVSKVGLNYAIVTTLIEDGVNVACMTENGHETCVAAGDLKHLKDGSMLLQNASADTDFSHDSTLVTSMISDKFLPNLLVGYVSEATVSKDRLTQTGKIRTACDFTNIRHVLVLTRLREELKEAEE